MDLGVILQQYASYKLIIFLFINDLRKVTTKNAKLVLYADDARISPEDFKININKVICRYK
jgi:hypothetical protein